MEVWATKRLLKPGALDADVQGCLRTVLADGVVTEKLAAKWNGRGADCPHCRHGLEDHEHRFWLCTAWHSARCRALEYSVPAAPRSTRNLWRHLPDGVARTVTLAVSPELEALQLQAECEDPVLPPQQFVDMSSRARTVWTDGACLRPADPFLRRAGWALRLDDGQDANWGGPVQGAQTVQRAELTAAVAASRLAGGPLEIVSDSEFVVLRCAQIAAGANEGEWDHDDLWKLLAPHIRSRRVRARWIVAHLSPTKARARGLSERDRLGNAAADSNAGAAATCGLPGPARVSARQRQLDCLDAAQRLMATVELEVMKATGEQGP